MTTMARFLLVLLGVMGSALANDPKENRLLIATSGDGLAWTRQNQVFYDSADVPDAVFVPGSRVYLYFQNFQEPYANRIYVGFSSDGLTDWIFGPTVISGTEYWPGRPCDPDVIVRGDTFRLYFTGDPYGDMKPETYSAISFDGMNFFLEPGVRFEAPGFPVMDPSLLWAGDTLRYFAGGAPPGENFRAHSSDGMNFTQDPNFFMDSLLMANGLAVPGGYRFYGFKLPGGIESLFSSNGANWSLESGYRLELDTTAGLESGYVKDPAVVKTSSGYIMYYVTRIPPGNISEGQDKGFSFSVYPNPARDFIRINLSLPDDVQGFLRLYDAEGKMIRDIGQPQGVVPPNFTWAPDIPPGVYFLNLTAGERSAVRRIVVLR